MKGKADAAEMTELRREKAGVDLHRFSRHASPTPRPGTTVESVHAHAAPIACHFVTPPSPPPPPIPSY